MRMHCKIFINAMLFIFQVGWQYAEKYGSEKVRVLTLKENKGKGGAVRMVRSLDLSIRWLFRC